MPGPEIKFKSGYEPVAPEPEEKSDFFSKLMGLVPAGIRVGSGVLAGEGGVPGALISGGGEALAELAEGQVPDWKRVAVEGGIGAVPLGKIFKAGRVVSSGLKSGALAGIGEGARELAKGEDLDPGRIGTSTVVGGLTGGALAKVLGLGAPKAASAIESEVIPTAQTGRGTGVLKSKEGGLVPVSAPRKMYDTEGAVRKSTEIPYRFNEPPATIPTDLTTEVQGVPYSSNGPEPYRSSAKAAVKAEAKAAEPPKPVVNPNRNKVLSVLDKQFGEAIGAREARDAREAAGLTSESSRASTSVGGGGEKFTTTYEEPKIEQDFAEAVDRGEGGPKSPTPAPPDTVIPNQSTTPQPPPVEIPPAQPETPPETPGVLARFFKTRQGATGLNYRQSKGTSAEPFARDQHLIELGKEAEGPLKSSTPNWIDEENAYLDRLKSEKGEIDPRLLKALTGLSGAAIGAPIGAGMSDDDNKLQGALGGAAVGGALGYGVPGALEAIKNPEIINESLTKAGKLIPSIQRANLLTSGHGLAANALAGPYGSAVMGSIEKGLSGDSRGWDALRNLSPQNFFRHLPENFEEARGLIGRAEGTSLDAAATPTEKLLAVPGSAMTTGDLTARNLMEEGGGFLPEETREVTMTNEPWSAATKKLANLSKGSPLLQFMFPFSRTTANILEQGAARTPGLGFLAHRAMEQGGKVPETLRTKLIQQALGLGMGTGAGVVGANIDDPETAKIARKYISNAAGQYSIPASVGFTIGQALNQGKPGVKAGLNDVANSIPLPTLKPLQDLFSTGSDLVDVATGDKDLGGPEFSSSGNLQMGDVRVPHSMYPAIIRDLANDPSLPSFNLGNEDNNQPVPQIRFRSK